MSRLRSSAVWSGRRFTTDQEMYTCIHYTPSGIRFAFPATQLHTSALALISDEKSFFNVRNQSTETKKQKAINSTADKEIIYSGITYGEKGKTTLKYT